eukprot:SAG22_NODE_1503_length_4277_cov_18.029440_3_plen_206_part_00
MTQKREPIDIGRAIIPDRWYTNTIHERIISTPPHKTNIPYPCVTIYFSNQPIWADCRIFNFCLFQFRPGLHRTADPYLAGKLSLSAFQRGMGRVCAARHPEPVPGQSVPRFVARARAILFDDSRQHTRRWRSPGSAPACPPQPRRHRRRPPPAVLSPSPPLIPRTPGILPPRSRQMCSTTSMLRPLVPTPTSPTSATPRTAKRTV